MYVNIDEWFISDGVENDNKDKKTIAFKSKGNNTAEIIHDIKSNKFEIIKNNEKFGEFEQFSICLRILDDWFSRL